MPQIGHILKIDNRQPYRTSYRAGLSRTYDVPYGHSPYRSVPVGFAERRGPEYCTVVLKYRENETVSYSVLDGSTHAYVPYWTDPGGGGGGGSTVRLPIFRILGRHLALVAACHHNEHAPDGHESKF